MFLMSAHTQEATLRTFTVSTVDCRREEHPRARTRRRQLCGRVVTTLNGRLIEEPLASNSARGNSWLEEESENHPPVDTERRKPNNSKPTSTHNERARFPGRSDV